MKTMRIPALGLILLFSTPVFASDLSIKVGNRLEGIGDVSIRIRHESILIYPNDDRLWEDVEITEDRQLYVNGEKINLSRHQEEMVEDYYRMTIDIIQEAHHIGWEGAKVGAHGAKIGLQAVVGIVKLLSPDYDSDDLERDLDRETKKIEKRAEALEDKADDLEDLADELEALHWKMRREIGALKELAWF